MPARIPPVPEADWPEEMGDAIAALRPPAPRHPFPPRDPAHLDEQQLLDVVFTVGAYDLVAMAFRSFGVEPDEDLRAVRKPSSP